MGSYKPALVGVQDLQGDDLVATLLECVCQKVQDMGSFEYPVALVSQMSL